MSVSPIIMKADTLTPIIMITIPTVPVISLLHLLDQCTFLIYLQTFHINQYSYLLFTTVEHKFQRF